ncbi:hypothetical protein LZD49_33530 [Dyadobacter sp. CY261]|uniref:hypothetical protein n=1 Tax=Dyadobacter sp. CY261 TaxID=2907203 RepID=UPI001F2EE01A|nr:hypothetical protein [Dyadobacter sp. CY261]MCF0075449.1 hypothetical protein [Dyadobacter sp. CY261]
MLVEIDYTPRDAFLPYHESDKRFGVTVAHRRAGKTVARINRLIKAAITCNLPTPRFGYLAPYWVQAKDIAWLYLKQYSASIIDAVGGKINESELSVTFGHNGAIIKLYGAENAERMRGLYFDGIVIDEGQGMRKSVLTTIILPALADRQGWLDVSGTPKGWGNLLGELVKTAQTDVDEWFLQILKASDTNIIPSEELRRLKALMSENEYAQEFECDFDAAITGAVYAKQLGQARAQGRITCVPYDPGCEVFTAWDLGFGDSTAIWWMQWVGRELRWIDYYENSGHQLDHYAGVIKARTYNYARNGHFLPHDGGHGNIRGDSVSNQLFALGVDNQVLTRETDINPGIEQLRQTIAYSVFDSEKCRDGLDALEQYAYEWDDDKGIFKAKPQHNWTSHAADAARYAAIAAAQVKAGNTIYAPSFQVGGNGSFMSA